MTFLTKVIGVLALFVAATSAQIASAQERFDFDCKALLEATRFQQQATFGQISPPLLFADDLPISRNGDPINTRELLEGDGEPPILARSNVGSVGFEAQGQPRVLSCNIIIVDFLTSQFETNDNENVGGERVGIRAPDETNWGERLAILTIGIYDTTDDAERVFDRWDSKAYNMPAKFDDFDDRAQTAIRGSNFLTFDLFLGTDWDDENVDYVNLSNVGSDVKNFLTDNNVSADTMLVFCGTNSCREMQDSIVLFGVSGPEQTQSAADTEPTLQPRPDHLAGNSQTADEPQPQIESSAEVELVVEPEPEAGLETVVLPPTDVLVPYKLVGEFTFVGKDGNENTAGLEQITSLECMLATVSDDLFVNPPVDCEGGAFKALKNLGSLLQIVPGENRLQIVAGARYPDPLRIEVSLPNGILGTACQLDVAYENDDGVSTNVQLEQIANSDPVRFAADLYTPPLRDANAVVFDISVVSAAGTCGGAGRIARVDASTVVTLPLLEIEPDLNAVSHVLVLNQSDLAQGLGLNTSRAEHLGSGLIDAIQSAHTRLAGVHTRGTWTLVNGSVVSLKNDGQMASVVNLNANTLRNQVGDVFSQLSVSDRAALSSASPSIANRRLSAALLPVVKEAEGTGRIQSLTLNVIAPVSQRTARGLVNPCNDSRYLTLQSILAQDTSLRVQVNVFPMVRLLDTDDIAFSDLLPVQVTPQAASLPSGLYACQDAPKNMAIYPYFFEPWRAPIDFANRYAAALSDQLAVGLNAIALNRDGQ